MTAESLEKKILNTKKPSLLITFTVAQNFIQFLNILFSNDLILKSKTIKSLKTVYFERKIFKIISSKIYFNLKYHKRIFETRSNNWIQ